MMVSKNGDVHCQQFGNFFSRLMLSTICDLGRADSIIPTLQRRTLRLAQGHRVVEWWCQGSRSGLSGPGSLFLPL